VNWRAVLEKNTSLTSSCSRLSFYGRSTSGATSPRFPWSSTKPRRTGTPCPRLSTPEPLPG